MKVRIEDRKLLAENDILINLFTQQKAEARKLISFIKHNSTIGRNDSGYFVFDHKSIPNFNIKDLIIASVGKHKPTGRTVGKNFEVL